MDVKTSVDLTGTFAGDLHFVLREAAQQGPLAVDVATGATVVLRQRATSKRWPTIRDSRESGWRCST